MAAAWVGRREARQVTGHELKAEDADRDRDLEKTV
jgi:hypothetical protein